ncbi:uroporphyrinogen-III synthase [Nioella nitratireducens]|uniref:uroporphyrinogen-III synthase n=1 Tax=Nioella nitratireducens TaxID=1287720 RepID=UPI0008FD8434|nr:uroporphyrinogen-III synthase [Nioella nitratireducens]
MPDNAVPVLLLTRPRHQADRFAAAMQARCGPVDTLIAPMQEIVFYPVPDLPDGAVLVFTSENGVRAVADVCLQGVTAYCVGTRTAKVALEAGFDAISAQGTAHELTALLLRDAPQAPVVHLHGTHVRGGVVARLGAAGLRAEGYTVYAQRALPLTDTAKTLLTSDRRVVVPLFSPRSAALFGRDCPNAARPEILCISPATRDALPLGLQEKAMIAETPDGEAMLRAVARQLCH